MMHQPIQDRYVVKYHIPFFKGKIGRYEYTAFLVALRDRLMGSDLL
ncbi:hypothetical protein SDC9_201763 [bioreactor metagenome]|uniref:Uncharacterized protein n=1 Tax=bioreactor metagenome TaxID=1076179 RepID=A0A645J0R4_9ZZZZ